jgi:DNA replication protein DnaC
MSELRSQKYWRNRPPEERVANTLIPKRFRQDTLDTFKVNDKDTKTFALITGWVNDVLEQTDQGQGLYIVGATGSGKTHLAQAVLKRVLYNNNLCGMFVTSDRYLQFLDNQKKFKDEVPDGYEDPNIVRYLNDVYDIVVLDGLGTERPTEFAYRQISTLIETRYQNQLSTIITTTLKPPMIEKLYSPGVSSIITSSCYTAPLLGSDYRINRWIDDNAGQ